jgi:hypothetical protein
MNKQITQLLDAIGVPVWLIGHGSSDCRQTTTT